MVPASAITSVILHLTFIVTFLVVASLSRIFGAAKKQRPLYKMYYVASFLMMLSMVLSMVGPELRYMEPVATALDVAGLLLGCAVTHFYWDWLPKELAKG
jgi:ABC-type multidrug transport system permease subunit